ncbi:MAG TPA: hypothetical protein VK452_01450 [Dissulfurispiraceae bacterium]|nr:hypothetical protein [Dissulfurispiraceae bacterium]
MHTDEYQISLNREIGVCRDKIALARQILVQLEISHGIKTEQFVGAELGHATISEKDKKIWKEAVATLSVWSERLREYEVIYDGMKK